MKPGDILVGKITPKCETELAPEERLLRAIFGEKAADVKDTSLTVPSGTYGIVMDVKVSSRSEIAREKLTPAETQAPAQADRGRVQEEEGRADASSSPRRSRTSCSAKRSRSTWSTRRPAKSSSRPTARSPRRSCASSRRSTITSRSIRRPIRNKILEIIGSVSSTSSTSSRRERERTMDRVESGDDVDPGIIKQVKVYIATKRKLEVGDKMAGRHGNKGVVAKIVPEEDMPFLADGTPVEICLNPLGVPSRMNVGQVLETHLGVAAKALGFKVATPVFDGIPEEKIREYLKEAKKVEGFTWVSETGKATLYDGRTGEAFDQEVVVGYIYMMKLGHLVADKIHARAVGPYSLVTQQPLGGKAQYGGQRFGEMEVWALEAYGAAYTLQELLTVKSDDVQGRTRIYESHRQGRQLAGSRHAGILQRAHQGNAVPRPRRQSRQRKRSSAHDPRWRQLIHNFAAILRSPTSATHEHERTVIMPRSSSAEERRGRLRPGRHHRRLARHASAPGAKGEVKNPETINYRTFKPEKGGLFCERIFGPTRDWECACGKYKRIKHKGVICDRCGVEVTLARVRRERMGHIELAVPVSHIWFFKCMPSRLGLMLDMTRAPARARDLLRELHRHRSGQDAARPKASSSPKSNTAKRWSSTATTFVASMGAEAVRDCSARDRPRASSTRSSRSDGQHADRKQIRKKLAKRLKLSRALPPSHARPEWMVLEVLPVIPPDLRPLVPLEGGRFATSDLNDLYRRVINRNNRSARTCSSSRRRMSSSATKSACCRKRSTRCSTTAAMAAPSPAPAIVR